MGTRKVAVIAALTIASTAVAAGTASAAPGAPAAPAAPTHIARGVDHGIDYSIDTGAHGDRTVTATIDAGAFALTRDGRAVTMTDRHGAVIAAMPTTVLVRGHRYRLQPRIDAIGRSLTLKPIDAFDRDLQHPSPAELAGAVACGVIGAFGGTLAGLVAGLLVGLIFLIVGAVPGALFGAIMGGFAGAGLGVRTCFNLGATIG
jgi:hypothetical protein